MLDVHFHLDFLSKLFPIRKIKEFLPETAKSKRYQIGKLLRKATIEYCYIEIDNDYKGFFFSRDTLKGDECFMRLIDMHSSISDVIKEEDSLIAVEYETVWSSVCDINEMLNAGLSAMDESIYVGQRTKRLTAFYQLQIMGVIDSQFDELKTSTEKEASLMLWQLIFKNDIPLKKTIDDIWQIAGLNCKHKAKQKRLKKYRRAFTPYAYQLFSTLVELDYKPAN